MTAGKPWHNENGQLRSGICYIDVLLMMYFISDPVDGVKGKTWGPSSVKNDRHHRSSIIFADGRWSKSAPNLEKSFRTLGGGHSNIGALKELCK